MKKNPGIFRNKKVCLLGPAPHIAETAHDYSQYDVICRVNAMIPVPEAVAAATTAQTDVWYVGTGFLKMAPELCAIPKIIRVAPAQKEFIPARYLHKISIINPQYNRLKKALNCTPNRGMRAMVDILDSSPILFYIAGITFYKTKNYYDGYAKGYVNPPADWDGNSEAHQQEPQFEYFIKHIFPFVKTDDVLKEIVEKHLAAVNIR